MNTRPGYSKKSLFLILLMGCYIPAHSTAMQGACTVTPNDPYRERSARPVFTAQEKSITENRAGSSTTIPGGKIIGSVLGIATAVERLGSHSLDILSGGINRINRLADNAQPMGSQQITSQTNGYSNGYHKINPQHNQLN